MEIDSPLGPFRALDLTDEKGLLCGRILADLGADVIVIEGIEGNPARRIGPFYHDTLDPERSLYWFAFSSNKRGITLNIETADGREIFKRLVGTADFLIESFPPGYMDKLGLGYAVLSEINPRIIMTSITPFGQTGPNKDYKASDIAAMAVGGLTYISGDPDRPPVRIPVPQSYLNAGAWAAVGSMIAFYHQQMTGEGQCVVLSMQQAATWATYTAQEWWSYAKRNLKREGTWRQIGLSRMQVIYPCKDGHVNFFLLGGPGAAPGQGLLVDWMDKEGMCPDWLRGYDFFQLDVSTAPQELFDRLSQAFGRFFLTKTKAELFEAARKLVLFLAPVNTARDILDDPQLEDREFWMELEYPELGAIVSCPGAFAKLSETPIRVERRAPIIGEHNEEVYKGELGLSKDNLVALRGAKAI